MIKQTLIILCFTMLAMASQAQSSFSVISFADYNDNLNSQLYEKKGAYESDSGRYQFNSMRIKTESDNSHLLILDCPDTREVGFIFPSQTMKSVKGTFTVLIDNVHLKGNLLNRMTIPSYNAGSLLFVNLEEIINADPNYRYTTLCDLIEKSASVEISFRTDDYTTRSIRIVSRKLDQNDLNEPRQYITIFERETAQSPAEPIWWLDYSRSGKGNKGPNRFVTNQKHVVISHKSILEIHFDQERISRNIGMQGSISLAAKSGQRKIEVSPYSVIGEERKAFGVNAMPIKEIADYFLRLMIEAAIYNSNWESDPALLKVSGKDYAEYYLENSRRRAESSLQQLNMFLQRVNLNKKIEYQKPADSPVQLKLPSEDFVSHHIESVNDYVHNYKLDLIVSQLYGQLEVDSPFVYSDLKQILSTVTIDRIAAADIEEDQPEAIERQFYKARLIYELLKRINESNEQTISAFLSFTVLTTTDFDDIFREVEKLIKDVNKFETYAERQVGADRLGKLNDIFKRFRESSVLFTQLLKNNGYTHFTTTNYLLDEYDTLRLKGVEKLVYDLENYNKIRDQFAITAGKEIFKKLVFGTIDLSKANIAEGQKLEVSVLWYNANGAANEATELATAVFIVRKTGWELDISESALLIHRIDEEKLRGDYPLSPSGFKPAAGASMAWSYYNPYRAAERRMKTGKFKGEYRQRFFPRFIHWLEPSFGINVAYLDFRTDRDVEFGAGPIIGLFQNRLFFTGGYNFSVNGESPFYMGIGFSFSNIYQRIKDNEGK